MKPKNAIFVIMASILIVSQVGRANATCTQEGKIARSVSTTNGVIYFYIAPPTSGLTPFNMYFLVGETDASNANMLLAALAGGHRVSVLGNATSCPTTGSNRFGGEVQTVNVLPRY
ncbi:MAG: hypothetical protein IPN92_02970 [Chromatiaceae bacterium]|nr:hypothetical protein [Chromatiaceae bacterium]